MVGSAWLGDVAVRIVTVAVDRVPARQAATVQAVDTAVGAALLSGYWLA